MSGSKPSLFSRPAWAATSKPTTSDAQQPVFGQQHLYEDIVAIERKQKAEREERRRVKAEKAALKSSEEDVERASKKRRLSKEPTPGPSDTDASNRSTSPVQSRTPELVKPVRSLRSTPKKDIRLSEGLGESPSRTTKSTSTAVINLDDSDGEVGETNRDAYEMNAKLGASVSPAKARKQSKPQLPPEDEEDDPFLRELQIKAREKARQQRLEAERKAASPSQGTDARSPSFDQSGASPSIGTPEATASQIPTLETNVAIWIQTKIPNTKELIINRHTSQPLQKVREFWTQKHKLPPALADKVFFTWRGTRLYNSSTTQSLIDIVKKEKGIPLDSDEDPTRGQLQITAVTQDILDQEERAKEQEAKAARAAEEEAVQEEKPKEGIVLILRCKGVEDMTLRVRPNTKVGKIKRAFQSQRNIDREKTCWLVFDGDRLEEELTAEDAGFEDHNVVEVHPR